MKYSGFLTKNKNYINYIFIYLSLTLLETQLKSQAFLCFIKSYLCL